MEDLARDLQSGGVMRSFVAILPLFIVKWLARTGRIGSEVSLSGSPAKWYLLDDYEVMIRERD